MASEVVTLQPSTWSALVDVMLEAFVNLRRKRDAKGCDISGGWCWVHDSGAPDPDEPEAVTDPNQCWMRIESTNAEMGVWSRKVSEDYHFMLGEFRRMAQGADRAVEMQETVDDVARPRKTAEQIVGVDA